MRGWLPRDDPGDATAEVSCRPASQRNPPTVAARQAATLDRLSNGRACLIWSQAAIHKSWQATACSLS